MNIVERVKNICLTPVTEWPVIAAEQTSAGTLVTSYVVPLAAIGAVAGFLGGSLIGRTIPFVGTYRMPVAAGLAAAVFTFVMAIVSLFILSAIINALAPSFDGQKDSAQAFKVAVYSYTPAWVAGVLQILPLLGLLGILAGLYGLYLLYLGLPRLMKCPEDKAIGYTAVVVVCAIVMSLVITSIGALVVGAGLYSTGALGGAFGRADRSIGRTTRPMSSSTRTVRSASCRSLGTSWTRATRRWRPRRSAATRAARPPRRSKASARCLAAASVSIRSRSINSSCSCPTPSPGCRRRAATRRRPALRA